MVNNLCEADIIMDALCLDFVNSEFRDFRGRWVKDYLQRSDWLEQFLSRWGLQIENPLDTVPLTELVALRALLQHMTEALADGQISHHDEAALNAILLKVPLHRRMMKYTAGYRLEMIPLKKDWDWVQAEIAASFIHILTFHDPRRLKVCANTNCRSVFYDESKSRTKRYCTLDKCANLLKIRRFRARHKTLHR
ncbi:MAG TPA: CGNR zinc finger domain-containing protein [Ktedonobacteraceae bacterium]|jgi:predicted RNA-binding Zn ribbon-like protein